MNKIDFVIRYEAFQKAAYYMTGEVLTEAMKWLDDNEEKYFKLIKQKTIL